MPKQPLRQKASMRGNITNVVIDNANIRPIIISISIVMVEHVKYLLHINAIGIKIMGIANINNHIRRYIGFLLK